MTPTVPTPRRLRTLIVDDTALYRRAVTDALTGLPCLELIGTASNGRLALTKLEEFQPDLMTLDIEMPELNGIEVLEAISNWRKKPAVIVLSAHTVQGSNLTMRALELGAFDFVTKPEGGGSLETLKQSLAPRIQAFADRALSRSSTQRVPMPSEAIPPTAQRSGSKAKRLIVVGVSTGGPQALAQVLPSFPSDLSVPVLIVQHMPPLFTQALAESLQRKCALKIKEAEHGEHARPGMVYIAPGGRHMKIQSLPGGAMRIEISDDRQENHCRPSVDYLFRSVALQAPGSAIGVVLTGMGNDGAQGLRLLKRSGCATIAQDEASSVVYGMPREAVAAGAVDDVLPLESIAGHILHLLGQGKPS
jgi:two-component system chemotaxis response regulator CheB